MGDLDVTDEAMSTLDRGHGWRAHQQNDADLAVDASGDAVCPEGADALVDLDPLIDRTNRDPIQASCDCAGFAAEAGVRAPDAHRLPLHRADRRPRGRHRRTVAYLVTGEFREFSDASHPG